MHNRAMPSDFLKNISLVDFYDKFYDYVLRDTTSKYFVLMCDEYFSKSFDVAKYNEESCKYISILEIKSGFTKKCDFLDLIKRCVEINEKFIGGNTICLSRKELYFADYRSCCMVYEFYELMKYII